MDKEYPQSSIVNNLIEPAALNMNRVLQPKTIFSFENNDNFNTESTVKVTPPSKTKRRKINGDAPRSIEAIIFIMFVHFQFSKRSLCHL